MFFVSPLHSTKTRLQTPAQTREAYRRTTRSLGAPRGRNVCWQEQVFEKIRG
jgi:hypothetical protein